MTHTQMRRKWLALGNIPWLRRGIAGLGYALGGFALSLISLAGCAQPISLGLVCALTGWRVLAAAVGSLLGLEIFWGMGAAQGKVWTVGGCLLALVLGKRREAAQSPFLLPAAAGLLVSATGLLFQMFLEDRTPLGIYYVQVALASGSAFLFLRTKHCRLPAFHRGETALTQVRLEILAGVLDQTRQQLLEAAPPGIDEDALLARTRERACGSCPVRKNCQDGGKITTQFLHIPLNDTAAIPCRKPSRMLLELRRSQEQFRALRGEAARREECRLAVMQQYRFVSRMLRDLSAQLPQRGKKLHLRFRPESEVVSCGREPENGDLCQCFDGPGGSYFLLICDGMGTGLGAAQEAKTAMGMLKKMLTAGFPPEHALESVNSLCCLRGRAGAVTMDLTRIDLSNGKAALYKWGAAPSYVLGENGMKKIGTAGPPPGLQMEKTRETVDRLSLGEGEVLILVSDGVEVGGDLSRLRIGPGEPLGEIAAKFLESGWLSGADDATVAAVRLHPST